VLLPLLLPLLLSLPLPLPTLLRSVVFFATYRHVACIRSTHRGCDRVTCSEEQGADIAFQRDNVDRWMRRLIVFDMDSTLIQQDRGSGRGEEVGTGPVSKARPVTAAAHMRNPKPRAGQRSTDVRSWG